MKNLETYQQSYAEGFQAAYQTVSSYRSKLDGGDMLHKEMLELLADVEDNLVEVFTSEYGYAK